MNRTKKQYLAKKTLAMVMAVAMVVTMVPSTTAAATEEPMEIAENDEGNVDTSLEGTIFQEEDSEEPEDVGTVNGSDDEADEDSTLEEYEDGGETNQSQEIQPSDESTITAGTSRRQTIRERMQKPGNCRLPIFTLIIFRFLRTAISR